MVGYFHLGYYKILFQKDTLVLYTFHKYDKNVQSYAFCTDKEEYIIFSKQIDDYLYFLYN